MALNYSLFRIVVAPEFAGLDNTTLDIFAAEAEIEITEKKWSSRYPRGVALITAHLIAMSKRSAAGGSESAGQLKRTKVGNLEREFAVSTGKDANDAYNLTSYGKEFLRLRRQVLIGPVIVI